MEDEEAVFASRDLVTLRNLHERGRWESSVFS